MHQMTIYVGLTSSVILESRLYTFEFLKSATFSSTKKHMSDKNIEWIVSHALFFILRMYVKYIMII